MHVHYYELVDAIRFHGSMQMKVQWVTQFPEQPTRRESVPEI